MNSASDKGRQNEMSPRLSTLWNGKKLKILLRPSFACLCVLVFSRCLQRCVCVWGWVGALVGSIGVINLFVRVSVCESARVRIFPSIILRPLLSTNISILVKMDDFSWSASCQLDNDSHPPSSPYPPFQFAFHLCCFQAGFSALKTVSTNVFLSTEYFFFRSSTV